MIELAGNKVYTKTAEMTTPSINSLETTVRWASQWAKAKVGVTKHKAHMQEWKDKHTRLRHEMKECALDVHSGAKELREASNSIENTIEHMTIANTSKGPNEPVESLRDKIEGQVDGAKDKIRAMRKKLATRAAIIQAPINRIEPLKAFENAEKAIAWTAIRIM